MLLYFDLSVFTVQTPGIRLFIMWKRSLSTATSIFDAANMQQELLKTYLRRTSNSFLCLNNDKLAEAVCAKIGHELNDESKIVFEATPGNGVLTEKMLQCGVPRIRVFEHIEKRVERLKVLQKKYGVDRLEIVDKQIMDFATGNYKLLNLNREDMLNECFAGVPVRANWMNGHGANEPAESSIRFVAALSPHLSREFLTFLIYSLVHFEYYFSTGPTECYLFFPLSNYKHMLSRPSRNLTHYTAFTIHINSLFDFSEVDLYTDQKPIKGVDLVKLDSRTHTVISGKHFAFTSDRHFKSKESFVFVKLKPKPIVNRLGVDFLINYVSFVKQSFIKRSNHAIRYYDKHLPGCAVDLLGLGISYFKALGDLSSDEMFQIFSHLYRLPQYQTSIFKDLY